MHWRTWRQLCAGRQKIMRQSDTKWKKKDKASQPTALPLQDAQCWTWLFLSPLIRLFVHLLSRALARQCSDWIARFFLACRSSCWCFHLLPTPPSCRNVWLRKRTDNGRCRKTRCIGFAFESVKELFLHLTCLTLAFILLDAFVTFIINGQQRQILLLLHQSLSLLCRSLTEISVPHVCVILKKIWQFNPASGFV